MELGSTASYVVLMIVVGFFVIGLLSNIFFLAFVEENDKLNQDTSQD